MSREITYMAAVTEAIDQAMEKDETVILLGEDVAGGNTIEHLEGDEAWGGVFGLTKGIVGKYGRERVIDTPIAEQNYVGAGVGAAATGLRPIVELMFNDFIGYALDALLNQGSKMRYMFGGKAKIPMTLRTVHGAGASAAAQHSQSLYGMFGAIPGIKVVVPSNPYDAKGLLLAAVEDDNLVVFSEDKTLYGMKGNVPEEYYTVEIGKAKIIREGEDLSIVAIGKMVQIALEVADELEAADISVEVIDLVTVSPWDQETVLNSVKKTNRLIVIDEANPQSSTGHSISAVVGDKAFDYLDGPVKVITAPATPVPFASNLEKLYIPSKDRVLVEADEIIQDLRK